MLVSEEEKKLLLVDEDLQNDSMISHILRCNCSFTLLLQSSSHVALQSHGVKLYYADNAREGHFLELVKWFINHHNMLLAVG
jgi:hypothetical protein